MVAQSPTPYYTAIQNALAELVDLTVVFMGSLAPAGGTLWASFQDPWGGAPPRFRAISHPALAVTGTRSDFRAQLSFGVSARLAQLAPDVLLLHSWGPTMLEPLLWAAATRRPVVLWSESALGTGLVRSRLSDRYRRLYARRADFSVSIGSGATSYLRALGASPDRILEHALPSPLSARIAAGPLSAGDRMCRFLFVGRLVERKRPLALIRAFARLADEREDVTLHVVGDGPLLAQVVAEAGRHTDRVTIGQAEGPDLVPAYLAADVLVLPAAREVWGLVVNEALAAGLYVIASDGVMSAADLVGPGLGTRFPVDDEDALLSAMRDALGEDGSVVARQRRRERVGGITPESFAETLATAAHRALAVRRRRRALG